MGVEWIVGLPGLPIAVPFLAWCVGTGYVDTCTALAPDHLPPRGPRPARAVVVKFTGALVLVAVPFLVTPDWVAWCGTLAAAVVVATAALIHVLGARRYPVAPLVRLGLRP